MRLCRLRDLFVAVLAVVSMAGSAAAASPAPTQDPAIEAAQEADDAMKGGAVAEEPAPESVGEPRFWETGGVLDEQFGWALGKVAYVPFFNLLGGPNAEPLLDDAGNPVMSPEGKPVVVALPFVVVWLVVAALFFTIAWRFVNIRMFGHAIAVVRGKYDNPDDHGEVTHFQALASALSATVGLGNIAGVAIAISLGGPGATFWMICAGLLGMSLKFTECTLGQKYRHVDAEGRINGGPMQYLKLGLKAKGMGGLGAVLSVLFIIFCIGGSLAGGNSFQVNQSLGILRTEVPFFAEHGWAYGVIMAVAVGVVIIGGIKRIAQTAEKIVPTMCGLYLVAGLIVIIGHIGHVPAAIGEIISGAFSPDAMYGGVIGTLVMGFKRAAFSNEAGVGSAAIAHSAARTEYPVREGIVALLEPFIDTVLICTMTALVIVITEVYNPAGAHADLVATSQGAALTREAFKSVDLLHIGTWFPWVLLGAVVLFAYSTMISWSYYGERCWTTLFGAKSSFSYKVVFLIFVVLGSIVSATNVLEFGDLMILIMAFPNILGLYLLKGVVGDELREYEDGLRTGKITPYEAADKNPYASE